MAKNQSSTNSLGVCDKIYNAISVSPAFRRIRGITHRSTNSNPDNVSPNHGMSAPNRTAKVHVSQTTSAALQRHKTAEKRTTVEVIPIEFDPPENTMKPVPVRTVTGEGQGQEGRVAPKNSGHDDNDNDKFSDYINCKKMKIRTTSNVGVEKSAARLDSFNDKVSNYINHAKIKIRSISNVGGGKS